MNEHSFIRSIHRKLPKEIYVWKINDNYAGGVADAYYCGFKDDLWIEYKYVSLPKKDDSKVQIGLSALQVNWLSAQANRKRNVAVVVGSAEGILLLTDPKDFEKPFVTKSYFSSNAIDKDTLLSFIISITSQSDPAA